MEAKEFKPCPYNLKAILRDPAKNSYNAKNWIEIQKIGLYG